MQKRAMQPYRTGELSLPPSPTTMSRSSSRLSLASLAPRYSSSKESLLVSNAAHPVAVAISGGSRPDGSLSASPEPTLLGVKLKYISLLTLAVQNAALSIVMHYSRVSTPASKAYSPAAAVLLNEVLKGSISFVIALSRTPNPNSPSLSTRRSASGLYSWKARFTRLVGEIFAADCLKLSIPAILYVIQNSLQFVAISNLPVASFQVAYQMKIMTTAAFSVALLGRKLTKAKWLALLMLAVGVGIVQIQTASGSGSGSAMKDKVVAAVGSAAEASPKYMHVMNPLKGFAAVIAACFTSGLAGVYFEMVLKNSKTDLWIRNVQLSLFSLIPALLPVIFTPSHHVPTAPAMPVLGWMSNIFHNFGFWAWATVAIQVFGGLVTAIVIKYSDNILKGFATSLSIVLSFLASVLLFDYQITSSFLLGASTVLAATWVYNQPAPASSPSFPAPAPVSLASMREKAFEDDDTDVTPRVLTSSVLNEKASFRHATPASQFSSTQSLSSVLGINNTFEMDRLNRERRAEGAFLGQMARTGSGNTLNGPHHSSVSPYVSRSPSPFVPLTRNGSTTSMDMPTSPTHLAPPSWRS